MNVPVCRHCRAPLRLLLADLGSAPPSNAYLRAEDLDAPELWYPLRVLVCEQCWLVQTQDSARREELFRPDYAYFSSVSKTWLKHAEDFVDMAVARFGLGADHLVIELGANDGYLLQYVQRRGIPCLGIEPTAAAAAIARSKGLEIIEAFFGQRLAETLVANGQRSDLIIANNVLAHVPDINDFVRGIALLLHPQGVASCEFPHLLRLLAETQFDTLYHEHFSYLSLSVVERIFAANGLAVFAVEELPTHGGSLRVFAQRIDSGSQPRSREVDALLGRERAAGLETTAAYRGFQARAERIRHDLLRFLLAAHEQGKQVVGYGAAAKGNTLLNFAGVRPDLLPYVVDRNPAKQGRFLPGSRIPIVAEDRLAETQPDYVLLLPWNLRAELMGQLAYVRSWGGQWVIAIPHLEVFAY
ncbi:class I SAM-dependent methyltransferase [Caldichromatium japonicum]|uniref:Class I SAM-dependent methyltransferase n=1 Tax=Caldichromatium japonicum TaxID=2699430 RepID=A0A6G7VE58_9GAMM|nr:class I SAM-dependent methyltransferase [Caldichromatium japonicum]QIK38175.1 class I SAM-dependent methyltransferase [Caldichromatium japonicum]